MPDSLEHLLECAKMGELPSQEEDRIEFLRELTYRVCKGNPGLPIPIFPPTEWDLELTEDSSPSARPSSPP